LDQGSGHSFCSTVPTVSREGRYPLRDPMESGLSSPTNKSQSQRLPAKRLNL